MNCSLNQLTHIKQLEYDNIGGSLWEEMASLIREAFAEHAQNGLTMMPCSISAVRLKARSKKCIYFLAYIEENLVGLISLRIEGELLRHCCGYIDITAVHPEFRRKKIAKQLYFQLESYAQKHNLAYIYLDTSCKATSSQQHHISNGYKPWYYTQFSTANYRSIVMRKDINVHYATWKRYAKLAQSWIACRLKYNSEGHPSQLYQKAYFWVHPSPIKMKSFERKLNLEDIQNRAYQLLVYFDQFCEKHGLRYFLCYGSLIGAIRHEGFIPWDDDIDVTMPLPDYEKFLKLKENDTFRPDIGLIYGMKEGAGTPFAMLTDMRTVAFAPGRDLKHTHPVSIDIFPAYALSNNKQEAQEQIDGICNLVAQTHQNFRAPSYRRIIQRFKFALFSQKRLKQQLEAISAIIHRYPWGSTEQIRIMSLDEREYLAMRPDEFDCYLKKKFEGGLFRIPETYHEHLSELYGDYMTPPPPENRHGVLSEAYQLC